MAVFVRVLADSVSPEGVRLTSMEMTYPRIIHAELMTHRVFSRNTASSRAIKLETMLKRIQDDPFIPLFWGRNQPGMTAGKELTGPALLTAKRAWNAAYQQAMASSEQFITAELHKQIANRPSEPYQWMTALVTATEWTNFLALRDHRDAQPEFQILASLVGETLREHEPEPLQHGQWHMPLVTAEERAADPYVEWLKVAVGRCCRISYLTHDGRRDVTADIALYHRLVSEGHMSPTEHIATPFSPQEVMLRERLQELAASDASADDRTRRQIAESLQFNGNFRGWTQLRKTLRGENDFSQLLRP